MASDRALGLVALGLGALVGAGFAYLAGVVARHSAIDALTGGLLGPDAAAVIVDTVRSTLHTVLLVVAALAGLAVLGGGRPVAAAQASGTQRFVSEPMPSTVVTSS